MNPEDPDRPWSDEVDDWDADDWEAYLLPHHDAYDANYEEELEAYELEIRAELESQYDALFWERLERASSDEPPPGWADEIRRRARKAEEREHAYWINKDDWEAVKVAADWKHAGQPYRAIAFAKEIRKAGVKLARPPWEAFITTIGSSRRLVGNLEKSLQQARAAIESNPQKPHAYRVAGAALHRLGRHIEAKTYFDKAGELDPERLDASQGKH